MNGERRFERRLLGLNLVLLVLLAVFVLSTFWTLVPKPWRDLDPSAVLRPVTARGTLAEIEETTIEVFRTVSPSVVHITTLVTAAGRSTSTSSRSPKAPGPASCGIGTVTS